MAERVRRDPLDKTVDVGNALEEGLRYEAPAAVQGRMAKQDIELCRTTVPAGSKVLLLIWSASRDERKAPDPDRFDIHRWFDSPVSFGHGIHFCLGAGLARLENRVAPEEMLRRFLARDVDHDHDVRLRTSTVRPYAKLPILV